VTLTWTDDGIGRVLDSRYRIAALIGTGASARVFLADDFRLRRQVAVKVLHPSLALDEMFLKRFEQEARAAAAFSHPHVVAVHDWGETDVGPYLVTEYLAGGSLHALQAAGNRLTPSQAVKVGLEAASGLAAAHRRGFAHRDIKPANLLFDPGSRLRVADFGLVHALSGAAMTEPDGVVLGTVRYSAPERSQPGVTDGRTDVYSLALTLVESVVGEVPLSSGSTAEVMMQRANSPIEIPEVFGAARPILERSGAVDIEDRPTAEELMRALVQSTEHFEAPDRLPLAGAIHGGAPAPMFNDAPTVVDATTQILSPPPPVEAVEPAAPPKRSKHRFRWILAVLVLLVSGVVATGFLVSSVEPPRVLTAQLGELQGQPIAEIREMAIANGWTLDEDQVRSDTLDVGLVIQQSPGQGSRLASGASIAVDVVVGPLLRMSPWVMGLNVDDAVERLEARGFEVVARDPQFDEVVPAGAVMASFVDGSSVAGGLLLEPGTRFDLLVSSGPIPRTVPELVGLIVEDAQAQISQTGLVLVENEREFSETVPINVVISQSSAAGSQTARDSTVTVVVSKGQDRRSVPEVSGMTIEAATASLESVGLFRSGVSGGGDVVEGSSPRAGSLLRPGEGVELFAPR